MKNRVYTLLCCLIASSTLFAEEFSNQMEDTMYDTGRINVVLGVVMIIFILFFAYLLRLDGKVRKLEKEVGEG